VLVERKLPDVEPPKPKPAAVINLKDTTAPVTAANTEWVPALGMLMSRFKFPRVLRRRPVVTEYGLEGQWAEAGRLLLGWTVRGSAAGNRGDLYDNRDDRHSWLRPNWFPQLAHVAYSPEARAAGIHYGFNRHILFNAITIGNSSTALTGSPFWHSQARAGLTDPGGAARLAAQYAANHLYIYPEHKDHDPPDDKGNGDLFPANTPYMLISQGSSGSDRPLLRAVAMILAAFRPDTKKFLRQNGLASATVQWVFRHGIRAGEGYADYLGPLAHPSVFRAADMDVVAMIKRAHALKPGDVAPMIRMQVLDEKLSDTDIGAPFEGASEVLFDTPSAVARIWRSIAAARQMTVSVGKTKDPNGRPLKFEWKVLRGDPGRIRIEPLDDRGTTVRLTVSWHERGTVPGRPELTTDRIDIAVFANNGVHDSAPGFVSVLFPADQVRRYEAGPGGVPRIAEIDYANIARARVYTDPLIFPKRDWRDAYHYDDRGRRTGFTRVRGQESADFTRHGAKVLEVDARGRPLRAEAMKYELQRDKKGIPHVVVTPNGEILTYAYDGPDDSYGHLVTAAPQ